MVPNGLKNGSLSLPRMVSLVVYRSYVCVDVCVCACVCVFVCVSVCVRE
jgi:hypothetical protein